MKVPVKVEIDPDTKKFNVEVGVPPTTALIAKEANVSKGSGTAGKDYVGNISMEGIVKIAKMKIEVSYATTIKSSVKEIIGSCVSSGIKVENKPAKEIYSDLMEGKFDQLFT
jgi:large subunit ribosomal protein L11